MTHCGKIPIFVQKFSYLNVSFFVKRQLFNYICYRISCLITFWRKSIVCQHNLASKLTYAPVCIKGLNFRSIKDPVDYLDELLTCMEMWDDVNILMPTNLKKSPSTNPFKVVLKNIFRIILNFYHKKLPDFAKMPKMCALKNQARID